MAGKKGRSGRRRLPSAIKKANGTYRPSRAAKGEVSFPVTRLTPPEWLDEEALKEWERIVPLLDSVKVLTEPDLLALANYCTTASVAINATKKVNAEGLMSKTMRGSKMTRVNPLIKVAQEARAQCLRFAIEFGLTPAARSRIVGQAPKGEGEGGEKKDDAEDFLFTHPPKLVVVNGKKGG